MSEKSTTIHKDNELIRFEPIKTLSIESLRLLNYLYYHTQKYLNEQKDNKIMFLDKDLTLPIKQSTLRTWLELDNDKDYVEKIRETLLELSNGIQLKHYVDRDGESVLWGIESFIKKPKHIDKKDNPEDKRTHIFKLTLDKFMFNKIINLKSGWTEIDLEYQGKFRSGNTFRLYEYLKSIQSMKIKPDNTIEELNKLFNTKHKQLSKVLELVERQLKVINKETDILVRYDKDKKNKTVKFSIQMKGSEIQKKSEQLKNKKSIQDMFSDLAAKKRS